MKSAGVVCILGSAVIALGAYPATFPFENEAFVPDEMPAGTPNYTFDAASDTGGYVYYNAYKLNKFERPDSEQGTLVEADWPYWSHANGFCRYLLVDTFGAPPTLPASVYNCTDKDIVFAAADYTGMVNGAKVCSVGSCCENLMGMAKFGEDQLDWHSWFDDRVAAAMCGEIDEVLYCTMVGGHFQLNCMEFYGSSTTDRPYGLSPCYDRWMLYMMDCAVYKSAYTPMLLWEPPAYVDILSPMDWINADCYAFSQDRVCNPYSYFFPSSTSAASSSASASASASAAAVSESSSPASSVVMLFSIGIFLA